MGRLRGEAVRRKWRELIAEQERSGGTVAAFCRERRLCAPNFFWWKRKLRDEAERTPGFIELAVRPEPAAATMEMRLAGGRVLVLRPGLDLAWVRAVAEALEARP